MYKILDVCCGGRMFWFNKRHPDVLYNDNRIEAPVKLSNGATFSVNPDTTMDFRSLNIADETFYLVVFDPPHLVNAGEKSFLAKKYGRLDKQHWRRDLRLGFKECFRVLKPNGVLIFKWNENDIPLRDVLVLTKHKPLFGHPSGKASKTHWVTFMK